MSTIRLVTYPQYAGKTSVVEGVEVQRVAYAEDGEIHFQRYTKDYRNSNSRPYIYRGRGFATLAAAVRAVLRDRAANSVED